MVIQKNPGCGAPKKHKVSVSYDPAATAQRESIIRLCRFSISVERTFTYYVCKVQATSSLPLSHSTEASFPYLAALSPIEIASFVITS